MTEWKNMRLPAELHDRLKHVADKMDQAYATGRTAEVHRHHRSEAIPLWVAVERAVAELESKWDRGNRRKS